MPFAQIIIADSIYNFADTRGYFEATLNFDANKIVFKAPFHRELTYFLGSDSLQQLDIKLIPTGVFLPLFESSNSANSHIKKVLENKSVLDIRNSGDFENETYQKLTIGTKRLTLVKNNFNRYLRTFGKRLKSFDKPHHFFLAESYNKKYFQDAINWKESIEAISASGMEQPELQDFYVESLRFNIYDDFLWVAKRPYPSPIAGNPFKRYFYQIQDTSLVGQDTVLTILFHPKPKHKTQKLKGYMRINISKNALIHIWAIPTQENRLNLQIAHSLKPWNNAYVSNETRISLKIWGLNAFPRGLDAELIGYDFNYKKKQSFENQSFRSELLSFDSGSFDRSEDFWLKRRVISFDSVDYNTFDFYDTVGSLDEFKGLVNFGTSLFDGKIPVGAIDFDLLKILSFNEHEGLRIGFGGKTNNKLNEKWRFGAYAGYGLRDNAFKYGAETNYIPNEHFNMSIKVSDDLKESGNLNIFEAHDNPTFNSEKLRKYRVSIMDRVQSLSLQPSIESFKFLKLFGGLNFSQWQPTYHYEFLADSINNYNINSFELGLRYAFGERIVKNKGVREIIDNPYPVVYLQYTRSLGGIGSHFTFNRFDIKTKYQKRILGYGLSNIQIEMGFTKSVLPYAQLYVGRGGIRNGAVVFHNSFETMRYNEFLSDRHFSVFYSHNFGPIYVPFLRHFPSIEMLHNFGFGLLRNPDIHGDIDFKSMEKGFFESGAYIRDIMVIRNAGVKIGIGTGLFYRYGAYQIEGNENNVVFKFALNLGI